MAIKRNKLYSMSQTCRIVGVKPHMLKHWERKFDIKPMKNSAGRRIYTQSDIEKFSTIRHLIYRNQYTIQGAKRKLETMKKSARTDLKKKELQTILLFLKKELIALRTQLSSK